MKVKVIAAVLYRSWCLAVQLHKRLTNRPVHMGRTRQWRIRMQSAMPVERHINDLHAALKITPAEELSEQVASTMRENAKDLDGRSTSGAKAATASAIDDLNAYADIAQAHANGVKKLSSAFSGLYSRCPMSRKRRLIKYSAIAS